MPKRPTTQPINRQTSATENVGSDDVEQFLRTVGDTAVVAPGGSHNLGRLIFALDATASRQATWDQASALQADMFTRTQGLTELSLQLVYFRGYDECRASPWLNNAQSMLRMMKKISCVAGRTQIARVLKHAIAEAKVSSVQAVVFIGDAMEENVDELGELAGQLRILGIPVFIFQEGHDVLTGMSFKQIAQVSGGAHCRFDQNAAHQLGQLLNAVAVYAAGGQAALKQLSLNGSKQAANLLKQLD